MPKGRIKQIDNTDLDKEQDPVAEKQEQPTQEDQVPIIPCDVQEEVQQEQPPPKPDPIAIANKHLYEDENMQKIVSLLKEDAESGNPVARTLYAIFYVFVGANIPNKQNEAYAEALKWLFMNRMGALESKMLLNIIGDMVPGAITPPDSLYKHACELATMSNDRTVSALTASETAALLDLPVEWFSFSENTCDFLERNKVNSIGQLFTDCVLQRKAEQFDELKVVIDHLIRYLNIDDDVKMYIRRSKRIY